MRLHLGDHELYITARFRERDGQKHGIKSQHVFLHRALSSA